MTEPLWGVGEVWRDRTNSIRPSLHYTETGRRPRVALAAAVGVSRPSGDLGGGVLIPSYPLVAAGK